MAYHETDSITCWVRNVFEQQYDAAHQFDQETMRAMIHLAPNTFAEWCEERIRLACPNMPNTLFVAICSSVDWEGLRVTLMEEYELNP